MVDPLRAAFRHLRKAALAILGEGVRPQLIVILSDITCPPGMDGAEPLRVPKLFDLRSDPYERADITSNSCYDWLISHVFVLVPAQAYAASFLATFKEYPPSQRETSFSIDQIMDKMRKSLETTGR